MLGMVHGVYISVGGVVMNYFCFAGGWEGRGLMSDE